MPNVKISAAADAGVLDGTEKIPLARTGSTAALHTDPQSILNVGTITTASAGSATGNNGVDVTVRTGAGDGVGFGGKLNVYGGAAGATGTGGGIYLNAGPSGTGASDGGPVNLVAGAGVGASGNGGDVLLRSGAAVAGAAGFVDVTLGTGATAAQNGQVRVNGNAAIMLATFAWSAGMAMTGRTIFTATRAMRVTALIGRVDVVNGGAATFTLSKAPSGTAFSAGTLLHTGSFNLAGTANTNQTLALTGTAANLLLAAGDSVGIVETGALGTAVGAITVHLTPQ